MTTIIPEGERLKKAVKWISEQRTENPEANPVEIANRATVKFDLSPLEAEFLEKFVKGDPEK
ncbi:MAG: hypothetical protein B5M56_10035 [Desulfococcus sp. 4484_241]|nr:MAG: hypothetical protein B5M56_10035 [Desulfococcus sp. 4484_241]